jgi:hypothetical protein
MTTLGYLFLAIFGIFGAIGGLGNLSGHLFLNELFQITEHPQVVSPKPGDVLVGKVNVTGSTDVLDFQSAEVSFRYEGDTGNTWYLIQQSSDPVKDGTLAVWDTSTIADGIYRLRVSVILGDNRTTEVVIPDLRVRNYSTVETATPGPAANIAEKPTEIQPTATVAIFSTPTSLPDNPAQVTSLKLVFSLVQGAVFAVACFILLGIYLGLRAIRRRG